MTLDSTNTALKRRWSGADLHEGLMLTADSCKTAGRGRHGRLWASPPGNLYASFLIAAPQASIAAQIGFVAVVAVIDALAQVTALPLRCKWPNDVLLHGKKVCGILPELADADGRIVLGIGINLQPVKVADAAYPVTSLAEHGVSASTPDAAHVADGQRALAKRLAQWRRDGFGAIAAAWTTVGPGRGEPDDRTSGRDENGRSRGTLRGLDADGALLLDTDTGPRRILAGEVLFERMPELRAGVG